MEVTITNIHARQIMDSRGNPTVEVDLQTSEGAIFRAAVPSGASTGIYEAVELRDGDKNFFIGKGVQNAIKNIKEIIAPALLGKNVTYQAEIDTLMVQQLDGTKNEWGFNKGKLGANAILPVSMAVCRAGAAASKIPLFKYIESLTSKKFSKMVLPVPSFNVINGGTHAGNKLAFQEFMISPVGAESFQHAMQMGAETFQILKGLIKKKFGMDSINVGDEGGFAPNIQNPSEAFELLVEAIKISGYEGKIMIAVDSASSEFYDEKSQKYDMDFKTENNGDSSKIDGQKLVETFQNYHEQYPLYSIEDPFDQDDWVHWSSITHSLGQKCQIVGDDLLVTNVKRIEKAIEEKSCNALLLKLNQIGTVTEAIEASEMAQKNGWGVMVSHRSGETEDNFIADLVVGIHAGQLKSGAPCRSERLSKYNQLLRIEEALGNDAIYAGKHFHNPTQLLSTGS